MNQSAITSFVCLLLCISSATNGLVERSLICGANQSQRASSASHFDVDIHGASVLVNGEKNNVRLLSKNFTLLGEIGGSGWDNNQFDHPMGVWARNGIDVFVADYGNHRIQRFDRKLAYISTFSTRERTSPDERFGYPTDVAVSRLGDLFICDSENSRILKVVGLSKVERSFGGFDAGKGRLKKPNQIEIGPNDNVYVQDERRIVEFDNFGNFIREFSEEMFHGAPLLYADENGLGIVSENLLYAFDKDDRLQKTVALDPLLQEKKVRSLVFSRDTMYLLTDAGIITAPDPR